MSTLAYLQVLSEFWYRGTVPCGKYRAECFVISLFDLFRLKYFFILAHIYLLFCYSLFALEFYLSSLAKFGLLLRLYDITDTLSNISITINTSLLC